MDNRTVYCSTKRFEGDDAVRTALTLDMSNVTEKDLVEYAVDALVIKWQASIRRKKDAKVPVTATYIVPKPGTRAVAKLTAEQLLVEQYGREKANWLIAKCGTAEEAVAMLKKHIEEMEQDGE